MQMAFKEQGPKPFYNVEQAVGLTGVNKNGDVKLVQYMLRHIYGNEAVGLAVDGWIGPVTVQWIKRFQNEMKAVGNKIATDGRVDRAYGSTSSVSKTLYTIAGLNHMLKVRNPVAFQQLPANVPLNSTPSSNPYNPAHSSGAPEVVGGF
jgi:hypothetical protein